jgi:FlaA1/EpsC-like NDP-sugar epimerase
MPDPKTNDRVLDVALEKLLGRHQASFDTERAGRHIRGKVVLVTGAAGSIGSELCRQIANLRPHVLVGFDQAETPLFHLERELAQTFPELAFVPYIGNIAQRHDVNAVMNQYRPSIVFHAAAYKHVPMMERQILAAVDNNIFGTWQIALAASRHGVEYFVLISTDKVVRPVSVMGATKRVAELVLRSLQRDQGTKFLAVRFGNVIGSSGSVVAIFKEQIAAGGPLTVTHPEMRRYFMTASEAGQLVLQALDLGEGGEIFVFDMGEPVRIVDLARDLIRLTGLEPDLDLHIKFSGVRPGEKLFEELHLQSEHLTPTQHPKIKSLVQPVNFSRVELRGNLRELKRRRNSRDAAGIRLQLKCLIPDFCPVPRSDQQIYDQAKA